MPAPRANAKLYLATSNAGKLEEVRALASAVSSPAVAAAGTSARISPSSIFSRFEFAALPNFSSLPAFDEIWPTFAENATGKALHYSRTTDHLVLADDSGLVVPALGGAPGVHSARYAGPNATDADRVAKLLTAMRGREGDQRAAHFVCVIAVACRGAMQAVVSAHAEGALLDSPRGVGGFGYDPIFFFPPLGKTFAEISREEKNLHSHRGVAFRKVMEFLANEMPRPADPGAAPNRREGETRDDDGVWYSPAPK
ncbi:MAG: non-canonical purine NTP pyrophosphatase [Candidatus Acidiferrales bacterium]